jgi:gliding motility-associated-like protein
MKMNYLNRLMLLMLFMCTSTSTLFAQINVTNSQTAQQLVQRLVGYNVSVLNPTLNCTPQHNGQFTTVSSNLGLPGGVILCTGNASDLAGPYSNYVGQTAQTGGDPQLSALINNAVTNDACVLEFDFVPDVDTVSTLHFDYVFGSEEYPGYTCSQYNDVFGFLITGPGYPVPVNIALVPNTTIPVAINSVNSGSPSGGFPLSNCTNMGTGSPFPQYFVNNNALNGQTIALDGFTTVLQAKAVVYPCDTYHMKLGVANAVDHVLNSAVFLKENSFSVDTVSFSFTGAIASDSGYLVEGCTPATVFAIRTQPSSHPKKICLGYAGTATFGLDYLPLPDSLVIPAGATSASMTLIPIQDNIVEPGFETVVIERLNCCTHKPIDSITLRIRDSLDMALLSPNVNICGSDSVLLHVTGDPAFTYTWSPPTNVLNIHDTLTYAFPTVTTTYTVTAHFKSCPDVTRSLTANVEPIPKVHIMNDTSLCIHDPLIIHTTVDPSSFPSYNYTWTPSGNLSDPHIAEPLFSLAPGSVGQFTYVLTVKTPLGCTGTDTFTIIGFPGVKLINVTPDFTAHYGDSIQLNAEGAPMYVWTPDNLLNFPNTSDPSIVALENTNLRVIGINKFGCADTAYVNMNIDYTMFETLSNAFTPNNDGLNDVFHVGHMKFQKLIEFRIFNRWGQEVFSTTNANDGWDGTFKGVQQDMGVYQYLIRITTPDGKLRTYKGNVTLVR